MSKYDLIILILTREGMASLKNNLDFKSKVLKLLETNKDKNPVLIYAAKYYFEKQNIANEFKNVQYSLVPKIGINWVNYHLIDAINKFIP